VEGEWLVVNMLGLVLLFHVEYLMDEVVVRKLVEYFEWRFGSR
jgi:hypothetical protein